MTTSNTLIVVLLVLHFTVAIGLTWFVLRLIKRFLESFSAFSKNRFGHDLVWPDMIIAAGVIGLLFGSRIKSLAHKLGDFFMFVFDGATKLALRWDSDNFADAAAPPRHILVEYLEALQASFARNIVHSDFGFLIFLVAFFIAVNYLIAAIRQGVTPGTTPVQGNNPMLRSLLIFGVTLFSAFLSIASIVAVPEFEKLGVASDRSNLITKFDQSLAEQKLYEEGELAIPPNPDLSKVGHHKIDSLITGLQVLIDDYQALLTTYESNDKKNENDASKNFELTLNQRIGEKELTTYQQRLIDWYSSYHFRWISKLRAQRGSIISLSNRLSAAVTTNTDDSIIINVDRAMLDGAAADLDLFTNQQKLLNTFRIAPSVIPSRPNIGERHGEFFNRTTGWLLRTESESLAIIVGMFGFGLFGSIGFLFHSPPVKSG